jgi:LPS-assembly protein
LFYVYIPAKDQSKIPNFDSSENDFNFAQLFSENRFSSWDRINAANQLTAALTSRLISAETGIERLRLMLGQRYYFRNEDTSLYGNQITLQNNSKGLLGSLGGDLDQAWRLDSTYEYNQDLAKTQRYNLQVRYNPAPGKTVSLRYRYGRYDQIGDTTQYGPLRMVDLGVQWPIVRQWYAVGRESYSLIDSKPLEHLLGVEYNDGCWTARVVVKRTNPGNHHFFRLQEHRYFLPAGIARSGQSGQQPDLRPETGDPGLLQHFRYPIQLTMKKPCLLC